MPTPSSTPSFTTPIASIWPARACASGGPRHEIDARSKAGSPDPRRDKAVDNGGLRYGAMESALRPPNPPPLDVLAGADGQAGLDLDHLSVIVSASQLLVLALMILVSAVRREPTGRLGRRYG